MNRKTVAIAALSLAAAVAHAAGSKEVLARSKEAAGGSAWDSVSILHYRAKVETGGLSGTIEAWEDVRKGRFVQEYELGPAQGADGFDGKAAWFLDRSGQITIQDGGGARGSRRPASPRRLRRRTTSPWRAAPPPSPSSS